VDAADFPAAVLLLIPRLIGWQTLAKGPLTGRDGAASERKTLMGTRLYVGNLSFSSTVDTVREAFARIGEVTDVHIVTDRATGQSRGFGFVTMGSPAEAQKAIESMNGANLDGRALRVNEAEERPQRGGFGGGAGGGHGGGDRRRGGGGGGHDRRNRW
jgi:RNA recognition motif-containing protein